MLKGILQTDKDLIEPIRKYGCLFLCFAECSPVVFQGIYGKLLLNHFWELAVERKIISGDINKDGDYDDEGEAEILNHTELARMFNLRLKYDGKHHDAKEIIPHNVIMAFGQYWWKSGHFVVLNKSKEVIFDSMGQSNTVKNGKLISMRWYYAD